MDLDEVRGHLAARTYLQMTLKPHIYHIVGHTEAHHASTTDDIIEASKILRRVIINARGAPDMTSAIQIRARKEELIIWPLNTAADPSTLARAVTTEVLMHPVAKKQIWAGCDSDQNHRWGLYGSG